MVAGPFDDGFRARKAHGKAFTGNAVKVGLAGSRAVKRRIACNHVLTTVAVEVRRRTHDDAGAGKALTDIVIGFTHEGKRHTAAGKGSERLAGRAVKFQMHRIVRQPLGAVTAHDLG